MGVPASHTIHVMSLRLKFGFLLGLLALAVLLTLIASWVAFSKLQSEVRDPLRSMSSVLAVLGQSKNDIEKARLLMRPLESSELLPPFEPNEPKKFESNLASAQLGLDRQDLAGEWKIRSGRSALTNLISRAQAAHALGATYYALRTRNDADNTQDPKAILTARRAVHESLSEVHDLIERIEDRIVADTRSTVDFSDDFRLWLLFTLASAFLIVLLTAILGVVLVRRWILLPVAQLRAATARIATGEFAYRIPLAPQPGTRSDELHQLSAEVNHMAGMVKSLQDERVEQESVAALGEMIRRLAHNLRNPLGGIRGLAEITRSDLLHLGTSGDDLKANQTKIIVAVDRFEKWLNELLGATRPLTVQPEPTRIDHWLNGLADAHRPMAQTRGVQLLVDTSAGPAEATFDPRHLEHALSAMLSNAIESTSSPQARGSKPSGGSVTMFVQSTDHSVNNGTMGDFWTISITDQGQGIPPGLRESIFRPYFTTKRDGNGIGLAVALQVVKAHGGRIEVESPWPPRGEPSAVLSELDHWPAGARFTIILPFIRPPMANDSVDVAATDGQSNASGVIGGQDPRHRR